MKYSSCEVFFVLPLTVNSYSVTRNIVSLTGKRPCGTRGSFVFLWQEIDFLWQEILFLSQEKFLLWHILYSFYHKLYSSCHRKFFLWHGYISCDMKYIFCHRNDFSFCFVTRNIFLWDKEIILSCDIRCTSCNRICSYSWNRYSSYVYQQYFFCHRNYFSRDRE